MLSFSLTDPISAAPHTYKQALQIPIWKQAMQEEHDALMQQQTWTLVPLPPDKNLVSCKWIFKIKRNADGSIARHKARLVARGFSQEYGIDYDETYSPVVRHTTVRMILAFAAHSGWKLHQLDVKMLFCMVLFMKRSTCLNQEGLKILLVLLMSVNSISLYMVLNRLLELGMRDLHSFYHPLVFNLHMPIPSLFVKFSGQSKVYLLLYVDDISYSTSMRQNFYTRLVSMIVILTLHLTGQGDPNDRKSTTGFVILLNQSPISWCSKKQTSVSRSSTEAEYRSMADTSSELQWLTHLLKDLHIDLDSIPTLHCDNISALALATNPVYHSKLKHIEADVHFTRERVKAGTIKLAFISSKEQLADLFTKGLCSPQHTYLRDSLMLVPSHQAEEGY
ncbi:hypothetical protein M0R45_014476 [Rubus argutus]|uniref:Reverse transcriptase Ty1/copia-type domain-containing protein n=1 Tax=Rubus argutus TaxID=59490 RepID=A0AAW1XMD2_RUBAR